ncbi:MAG: diguanylate cyclase [Desulfococcaceae bacterium]
MKENLTEICQDIVENLTDGIRVLDKDGNIVYANEIYCHMLGYSREELVGKSLFDIFPKDRHSAIAKRLADHQKGRRSCHEIEYRHPAGNLIYLKILSKPFFDSEGKYEGSYAVMFDITDRKILEKQLKEEKDFLANMIAMCPDSIMGVNRQGTVIIFNSAAEKLLGYKAHEVIGKMGIAEVYGSREIAREIKKKIYSPEYGGQGRIEGLELDAVNRMGHHIPLRLSAIIMEKDGQETGSVGFFHDLTLHRQMENRLRELSVTDSLSGLFNQRHFYAMLSKEIERSRRYARDLSLICFDLDHFKQCNDHLGHLEGDNIIRMIGEILKESLRKTDSAFRYGGDEFMVLMPETDMGNARYTADRIRENFNSRWSFSHLCKDSLIPVTLSMGIARLSPDESAENFVKRADMAMYEAKRAGGNRAVEAAMQIGRQDVCL